MQPRQKGKSVMCNKLGIGLPTIPDTYAENGQAWCYGLRSEEKAAGGLSRLKICSSRSEPVPDPKALPDDRGEDKRMYMCANICLHTGIEARGLGAVSGTGAEPREARILTLAA